MADPLALLQAIYTQDPCRTLPNAFWKTAVRIQESDISISRDGSGALSSLVIWEKGHIMAFWCADPAHHPLTQDEIDRAPFALVHAQALPVFEQREFTHQKPYFRLVNQGISRVYPCPSGFQLEIVDPEKDLTDVVSILRACYPRIKINRRIVQPWLSHPVYDPQLWLWAVDLQTGVKAGLGIAERDPQVQEASLEWIQVLPAYQGKGLGKAIVTELVRRVSGKVKFITVSGEVENKSRPEVLYRGCGFVGQDIWWLFSDKV